jgi:hypothetical protein
MLRSSLAWLLPLLVLGAPAVNERDVIRTESALLQQRCACVCRFANPQITKAGKQKLATGNRYSFTPNVTATCTGSQCGVSTITYSWTVAGTSTHAIVGNSNSAQTLIVDITAGGSLTATCVVTVTCTDGTTCVCTGSRVFQHLN